MTKLKSYNLILLNNITVFSQNLLIILPNSPQGIFPIYHREENVTTRLMKTRSQKVQWRETNGRSLPWKSVPYRAVGKSFAYRTFLFVSGPGWGRWLARINDFMGMTVVVYAKWRTICWPLPHLCQVENFAFSVTRRINGLAWRLWFCKAVINASLTSWFILVFHGRLKFPKHVFPPCANETTIVVARWTRWMYELYSCIFFSRYYWSP